MISTRVRDTSASRAPRVGERGSAFPTEPPSDVATWEAFASTVPALELDVDEVVVVVPHPDDETLGAGGLLAHLSSLGVAVTVIDVTDGEGSHADQVDLAARRRAEQRRALHHLGLPLDVVRLGLPDGAVSDHEGELSERLGRWCRPGSALMAPWAHDGHADHDAVGRAATVAAAAHETLHLGYFVWALQWADPSALAGLSIAAHRLDDHAKRAKRAALAGYRSQLGDESRHPVLPPTLLAHAKRSTELFAVHGA